MTYRKQINIVDYVVSFSPDIWKTKKKRGRKESKHGTTF